MSPRKPNMLEAFQRSAQVEKTRRAEERAGLEADKGSAPGQSAKGKTRLGVGGPFDELDGDTDEALRQRPGTRVHGDEVLGTAPKGSPGFRPRTALLIAAILVAMVVVFQLGRDLGNESQAGGGDGSAAQAGSSESGAAKNDTPAEVPAAAKDKNSELDTTQPAKSSELTDDDRAFLDKDNNWTVIAISFDNNATGGRLALETYRYLREQGLPAVAPLTQGKFLTICVGAEATRNKAIEQIRERLRGLAGPPPRNEKGAFSSAYFANIEDQIDPKLRR